MPPTISPRSMKGRSRCEVKARIRSSLMQDPLQQPIMAPIRRRSVINGKQCASRLFGQRRVVGTGVRAPLWLEDGKRQEDDRVGIERMNDNYFGKLGINGVDEGCCQRQRITGNPIAINYCGTATLMFVGVAEGFLMLNMLTEFWAELRRAPPANVHRPGKGNESFSRSR